MVNCHRSGNATGGVRRVFGRGFFMKKTALLAAAAAFVAFAAPAAAQGYLGVEYGANEREFFGADGDGDVWQGEGAFGWNGGGWGAQLGGAFGNLDYGIFGDTDFWTLNGHLYWQGGSWRVGGVVAGSDFDTFLSHDFAYGVEGMFNAGPNTNIFASLTFGDLHFGSTGHADTWNVDVGANFYASPNIRFGGTIGTGEIDGGGGFDSDTFSAGVNGEFQPWSAPVSITLGWSHYDNDFDAGGDTLSIGARWNFGGGTLQDRNNATPFTTVAGNMNRMFGLE